jgi:cellulose synthase (UDP-forming)
MSQQALFFGPICRGKDGLGAAFCCGTCVVFRREAFESVGGFPTNSLTEDFELSIHLHEQGWKSAYLPDVLSRGVGPEDTAAYISQQQRWARGCLSGVPRALRARLPIGLKIQYLLSGVYWLSGWTLLIYMSFPVVRLLGGGQPIGHIDAPEFLLHFVPYYAVALSMAVVSGAGTYKFSAYALSAANYWIQILATIYTVLRKSGSFIVTPKKGATVRQPRAVMPTLVTVGVLVAVSIYGLVKNRDAATINNVSFAAVHVSILMTGCWAALQKPPAPAAAFEPAEVAA